MNILGYELHKNPPLGAFTGVWNHGVTAPAGRQIRDMSIQQLRLELAWVREQAV